MGLFSSNLRDIQDNIFHKEYDKAIKSVKEHIKAAKKACNDHTIDCGALKKYIQHLNTTYKHLSFLQSAIILGKFGNELDKYALPATFNLTGAIKEYKILKDKLKEAIGQLK